MHSNLTVDVARAFDQEVRRSANQPSRLMAHERRVTRRPRRGWRTRR